MKQNPSISERFRSQSNRLEGYDYSQNGAYFVTICVKERACIFGEIENGEMVLNECGNIIKKEIQNTEQLRSNVWIDSYVIMPNHLHIIIGIYNAVETHCNASLQEKSPYKNLFGPQKNNLASIIGGIKGKSTFEIRKIFPEFSWQSNYHDHIIRDETELQKIREYIFYNPANWQTDEENIS